MVVPCPTLPARMPFCSSSRSFGPALSAGSAVPLFERDPRPACCTTSFCAESSAALVGSRYLAEGREKLIQLMASPSCVATPWVPWPERTRGELRGASPRGWPSGGLNGGHGRHIEEALTTRLAACVPQLLYESPTRELAVFHYLGESPTPTRGAWQRGEANRLPMAGPIRRSSALRR